MTSLSQDSSHIHAVIKKSIFIKDGNPARYRLQTKTDNIDQSEQYRKMTFGERDKNKPHKTILMLGETGSGKTTLINTMINYMLDVQREDKVWFEITDDQSDQTSVHSQTSIITVYEFYPEESKTDLTIIDTPGYGDTRGVNLDKQIAEILLSLSESAEGINEIHAVCLVIRAYQNRLPDRQRSIFNAVQSLFGKDIAENIVLLFTHSTGTHPTNALTAVEEGKIKCAVNEQNQPLYFLFNNRQSDAADEEHEKIWEQSWNLSFRGIAQFFKFLDNMKSKTLQMTQYVLSTWKQLEIYIYNLQSFVQKMELKQNELKQTQEALEKHKEYVKNDKNFEVEVEVEVEVPYKENGDIDQSVANVSLWCKVCKEKCHYPENTSFFQKVCTKLSKHCTVCKNKCNYDQHEQKKTLFKKTEKRTNEDQKKEYDGKISDGESEFKKLEKELQELEKKKIKLVMEAFHCVETLQMIALNTDSLFTLQNIDFLIEKLKEIDEPEKATSLENIKKSLKI